MTKKEKTPYVPLWKQWQQSKEYQEYKKKELPGVLVKMKSINDQISKDAAIKEADRKRREEVTKEFQLRWVDSKSGKVLESKHTSEKGAKDKARDLSFDHSPVQLGEVDNGKLTQQWNFEKGRQQTMDTKKQVSVAPITKKEASSIKSNTDLMKGQAMATKKTAKKASAAKKAAPVAKKASVKGNGTIRDLFELREGSNKEKLVDALLGAKGKALPVSALLKATYGSMKEENKSALMMVMKGIPKVIDKNKIKMMLVKDKTADKEMTFALKAK